MKTTNEIIKDSAIILKNEIIVINDNDKKWYSEEEIREAIEKTTTDIKLGSVFLVHKKTLIKELLSDKE
jgi:hypothetical protein